ncbi:hypothetical protein R8Z57_07360 [Microbacterium sp. M3]|uniref:YokE-like PH domain-containing protein n=1 Tax=Microbacterium arthrosphaerae TaxID=792652 RepID=A0ABU4GZT4_9MICO|nr:MULTISPECIES: hypothetical protein [Microbacterium]MDW4572596.1 hypothetical protein [Microbacterium arthrosphaerae]MDW7606451.1 hypothetical protein [Microbacterium sp. M3]
MPLELEGTRSFKRACTQLQSRAARAPLMPMKDEEVFASLECHTSKETFHTERYGGGSGGSIGAFGVRVGGGSHHSTSERYSNGFQLDDRGDLVITSERVVFVGTKQTVEIPYEKLLEMTPGKSMLRVSARGMRKPLILTCKKGEYAIAAASIATALRNFHINSLCAAVASHGRCPAHGGHSAHHRPGDRAP